MIALPRSAPTLLAAALLTGCSFLPGNQTEERFAGTDRPITLQVQNNNFNDATLSVVSQGDRVRLGTVSGKMEESFTVPTQQVADVWYVEIDLVGGEWCRTDSLPVDPGDVLELHIALEPSETQGCYPPGQRPRP